MSSQNEPKSLNVNIKSILKHGKFIKKLNSMKVKFDENSDNTKNITKTERKTFKNDTFKDNLKNESLPQKYTCKLIQNSIIKENSAISNELKLDPIETVKKAKNELLVIIINCRSLANKEEEINFIIEETGADIICLIETWLDSSHPKNAYVPNGYKIIRKDRSDEFKEKYNKKIGGGVAIVFKENINISEKNSLSHKTEEILWLNVKEKNNFLLGIVYRPKYSTLLKENDGITPLEKNILEVFESHTNNVMVVGDFNVDMLDSKNKKTKTLKNAYKTYGLKQQIKNPTRIDKNSNKGTLIDHIWAPAEMNIITSGTFHGISDHLALYTKLPTVHKSVPKTIVKFRNFKNYNEKLFAEEVKEKIKNSDLREHIKNKDVNKATEGLVNILKNISNKHAPLKTIKISKKNKKVPWFTPELKEMIRTKNELLKDCYEHSFKPYRKKLTILANEIKSKKRKLKQIFIKKELEKAGKDIKKLWKILNFISNRTKTNENAEPENINQELADKYNKFFSEIGIKIQKELKNGKKNKKA